MNLEAFLWVDRSSTRGRLWVGLVDHQGEATKIYSQITRLRQFTIAEEEMLPRMMNPRRVE